MDLKGSVWGWWDAGTGWVSILGDLPSTSAVDVVTTVGAKLKCEPSVGEAPQKCQAL